MSAVCGGEVKCAHARVVPLRLGCRLQFKTAQCVVWPVPAHSVIESLCEVFTTARTYLGTENARPLFSFPSRSVLAFPSILHDLASLARNRQNAFVCFAMRKTPTLCLRKVSLKGKTKERRRVCGLTCDVGFRHRPLLQQRQQGSSEESDIVLYFAQSKTGPKALLAVRFLVRYAFNPALSTAFPLNLTTVFFFFCSSF